MQALSVTNCLGFGIGATQWSSSKATNNKTSHPQSDKGNTKRSRPASSDARPPGKPGTKKRTKTRRDLSKDDGEDRPDPSFAYGIIVESKLKQVLDLCDSIGIKYMEWDISQVWSWALLSSSCSLTGTHQDAAGYFTFLICQAGAKYWCWVDPKDTPSEITAAMKHLVTILKDSGDTETISDHADLLSLILTPGTMV